MLISSVVAMTICIQAPLLCYTGCNTKGVTPWCNTKRCYTFWATNRQQTVHCSNEQYTATAPASNADCC